MLSYHRAERASIYRGGLGRSGRGSGAVVAGGGKGEGEGTGGWPGGGATRREGASRSRGSARCGTNTPFSPPGAPAAIPRFRQYPRTFTSISTESGSPIFQNRRKGALRPAIPRTAGDAPRGHMANPQLCALRCEGAISAGPGPVGITSIPSISADVYVDIHRIGPAYLAKSR
jgi:hypothetical protein